MRVITVGYAGGGSETFGVFPEFALPSASQMEGWVSLIGEDGRTYGHLNLALIAWITVTDDVPRA